MRRFELTDEQWAAIQPLLPQQSGPGHPWTDHRKIMNGIFWRIRTGAPWRDVPERYGPWQTVYDRFNRFRRTGVWDRIIEAMQIRLDEDGLVDWDLWCVDGTNVRAARAAAGASKKGGGENPKTTHWGAHEAASQPSSIWSLTVRDFPSV